MKSPVPAAYPNIGSFSPVCDIMFPKGVSESGSLEIFGRLEVSEPWIVL